MRVAVDTNVLPRYITSDDAQQFAAAKTEIESGHTLVISVVVLSDIGWVLRSAYRYSRAEISTILRELIDTDNVEIDRMPAESGLQMLSRGGDFADGVIVHEAGRARFDRLVTFDRRFARVADNSRVALLPSPQGWPQSAGGVT